MIGYFPVQSYFSTKYSTKMQKNYTQKLKKILPPQGGIWLRFRKTLSYICRFRREKLKTRRRRKFSLGAQKCKKWQTKNPPPGGLGTDFEFNLGIPQPGDYRKSPHQRRDMPPPSAPFARLSHFLLPSSGTHYIFLIIPLEKQNLHIFCTSKVWFSAP